MVRTKPHSVNKPGYECLISLLHKSGQLSRRLQHRKRIVFPTKNFIITGNCRDLALPFPAIGISVVFVLKIFKILSTFRESYFS